MASTFLSSKIVACTLGAIPEVIYFTLFLIFTKKLKDKKILLFLSMLAEYIFLKLFINFDVLFQIIYTFMTFMILKMLYKEKAIITDIFAFTFSSIILIAVSFISYITTMSIFNNYMLAYIFNRILLFVVLFLLRNKLNKWYIKFNSLWNRKPKQRIRSLTVRNISIIIFNIMFFIINFGMIIANIVIRK